MKTLWTILALVALSAGVLSAQAAPAAGGTPAAGAAAAGGGGGGGRAAQPQPPANLVSRGGDTCAENTAEAGQPPVWVVVQKWNCINEPNPLPATTEVRIEHMTWMDVRDALAAGKRTIIIGTGGMEPNGPFLVTGKHNFVLETNCAAIARRLGNALCAPILKLVPEGPVDGSASGHMANPGSMALSQATYQAVLNEMARNFKAQGFTAIIFIGDSGSNTGGMTAVADSLTKVWQGNPIIAHVPEHYSSYSPAGNYMEAQCLILDGPSDNLHDDPIISLNMYANDPNSISYDRRLRAGLARINGVDISDPIKAAALANQIVDFRVNYTIEGIRRAIAARGNAPAAARAGGAGGGGGGAAAAAPAGGRAAGAAAPAAGGRAAGGAAPAAGGAAPAGARAGGAAPAAAAAAPAPCGNR